MSRKTNKQLIKEALDKGLTVAQLIEHLNTLPQDAYVGVVGHFGEAHLMDRFDFSQVRECYITPDDNWRNNERHNIKIIDLYVPDIGPTPD